MTPQHASNILRHFNEWCREERNYLPHSEEAIGEAIDVAVEMIERLEKMEAALRDHHKNAMCEGCDHSHPLTQLRLSAYQQSKLYADTVSALEETK